MSTPSTVSGRRLTAFRLADIPEKIRDRALSVALRREDDFMERLALGAAAQHPSARIYWVPTEAYERVMHPKNRRTP